MWNGPDGPASLPYGSEEWKQRVQQIEGTGRDMNYRGIEEYIEGRSKDEESFETSAYAVDEETVANWDYTLNNLTPAQLEDGGTALREMAKFMADGRAHPRAASKEEEGIQRQDRAAQKRFAGTAEELRPPVAGGPVRQGGPGRPGIAKLKGQLKMQAGPDWARSIWNGRAVARPTASEQKYQQFANTVRDLHTRQAFAKFQQWRNENGGAEVPVDVQSTLLEEAAKEVRKSDEYKAAKNAALGLDENGVAPAKAKAGQQRSEAGPSA